MTIHSKPLHVRALGILVCTALSASCAQVPSDDGSDDTSSSTDAQSPAVSGGGDAGVFPDASVYTPPAASYDAGYVYMAPTPTPVPKFDAGSPTDQLVGVFGSFANAIPGIFGGGPADAGTKPSVDAATSSSDAGDGGH